MGSKISEEEREDDEKQEALDRVANLQRNLQARQRELWRAVVDAHDDWNWTFREIGEVLDMAHSAVYHQYTKAKRLK